MALVCVWRRSVDQKKEKSKALHPSMFYRLNWTARITQPLEKQKQNKTENDSRSCKHCTLSERMDAPAAPYQTGICQKHHVQFFVWMWIGPFRSFNWTILRPDKFGWIMWSVNEKLDEIAWYDWVCVWCGVCHCAKNHLLEARSLIVIHFYCHKNDCGLWRKIAKSVRHLSNFP